MTRPEHGTRQPTLVDLGVLATLESHLDDARAAHAFVLDYIAGFAERFLRLNVALGDRDLPAAHDAALSLRSSSSMAGAPRLAAHAARLEDAITHGDLQASQQALALIGPCGLETVSELRSLYLDRVLQGSV
ncbi:Hpt domain-containing protein [Arthrobacter agilis]|uniref:Hpt domain-containing protein n=1 Tax=Arthrobacter agilis TaxID=37921 RepID=UPI000F7011B6|nr:Hpt domain-containing protein [Arthrobacter agilis]TPV26889.1 Hpt domain-containing protein [Arthrobacter agilis]VDR32988.1 Uncharacterised protein [Arthrobacter agilis]